MAIGANYWTIPGMVAQSSLASAQYYIVQACATAGAVKVATTKATDPILGVVQNDPGAGEAAEVAYVGICKVVCGAAIDFGAKVTANSTGQAIATTTDKDEVVGIALAAASATAGDIIPIMLTRFTLSQ